MKNLGIKGKDVVITGASSGIGCNLSLVGSKERVGKSPMQKLM